MIALPKATSQGSNGAGGGALRAFSGISAAYAEPAIANTAAAKTSFFITSPQKVISESASDRKGASRIPLIRTRNLVQTVDSTKQKMSPSALFLCVSGHSMKCSPQLL